MLKQEIKEEEESKASNGHSFCVRRRHHETIAVFVRV